MDTRDFFPKSTPSHWYCLPLLSSIPEESRASFLAGFCRLSIRQSLESCGEAGWNQSTHIKKEYSSKMEHSYYQKWNTHQNGTLLLLSKMEHSSKWNTPIIIKMEHSYYQNGTLVKMEHSYYQNGTLILKRECPLWFRMELSSSASHGLSNGTLLISMPWIIAKSLGSSFNDLLKTIKTIFNNITVSFSLTQGSPPPPDLDFGLCARVFSAVFLPLEPTIEFSTWSAVSQIT